MTQMSHVDPFVINYNRYHIKANLNCFVVLIFLSKKRRKSPPYLLRNRSRYYNNSSCLTGKPCRILVFFYPNYLNRLSNRLYLKITEMPSFWDLIKLFFFCKQSMSTLVSATWSVGLPHTLGFINIRYIPALLDIFVELIHYIKCSMWCNF